MRAIRGSTHEIHPVSRVADELNRERKINLHHQQLKKLTRLANILEDKLKRTKRDGEDYDFGVDSFLYKKSSTTVSVRPHQLPPPRHFLPASIRDSSESQSHEFGMRKRQRNQSPLEKTPFHLPRL